MHMRTLCLGILSRADATGYEIKKMCEEGPFSHFLEASYGSIYPALSRLTEEGLVTCSQQAQERRPDKKVYSITAKGQEAFAQALQEPPSHDKYRSEFLFVLTFADQLSSNYVSALVDEKIKDFDSEIARCKGDLAQKDLSPAERFSKGFAKAMFETCVEYLRSNRGLVEEAASEETAGQSRTLIDAR